jgi:fructokinase
MRIGVDLGGTKIEAAAIADDGAILVRRRIDTPPDYPSMLEGLAGLIARVESEAGAGRRPVGIGMPGSLSPATGLARNANSVWLNGKPFLQDASTALGRPVRIANDANCFALSEAVDGAAAGARVVFGAILGTGCGGGVVIDGKLIEGVNGVAGEWGHTPLPWPRPEELPFARDWCGRHGCLETWIAGRAGLERWAPAILGRKMTAKEIVAAAAAGDARAQECLDLLYDRLARAFAVVIDLIDPDVIVVGGGLSNVAPLYEGVQARWAPYIFSDVIRTRLVKNRHGDSSGVRGAAWLWQVGATA